VVQTSVSIVSSLAVDPQSRSSSVIVDDPHRSSSAAAPSSSLLSCVIIVQLGLAYSGLVQDDHYRHGAQPSRRAAARHDRCFGCE
jgi:hypothetical protein